MTKETFYLEEYLSNGVDNIINGIKKATLKNPKESAFMLQYSIAAKRARKMREGAEKEGEHIPPFLIASITNQCNLHCKGCYARANHSCGDECKNQKELLSEKEWAGIFRQAADMGVGFILLAGGEPFVRWDVIKTAGNQKNILFPIFTNGTLIKAEYLKTLEQNRNLIPILSIEGQKHTTDARRGEGIYEQLQDTMQQLHKRGILFGASVTVTKENQGEVLSDEFIEGLSNQGCKGIIYVEYVPVDHQSEQLALKDSERDAMLLRLNMVRKEHSEMVFVSFPGDEKTSGGCLAAGRGFFHINAYGGAEPCPFSPYSDSSLKDMSLQEALHSPLFQKLQKSGNLLEEHIGGCVLFEQEKQVQLMLGENA